MEGSSWYTELALHGSGLKAGIQEEKLDYDPLISLGLICRVDALEADIHWSAWFP
jgi:hypothetical protein